MPTYEYACKACGHQFEQVQSITAKPLTTCPRCKKRKVNRLISGGVGFIFKGSGFYITDYRSDNYKSAAKNDSGGSPKKSETASETPAKAASETTAPKPATAPPAHKPTAPAGNGKSK